MSNFKPMLASDADLTKLKFPMLVSPKLDGVRATIIDGEPLTRSLKKIPNLKAQTTFKVDAPLDGEFIVGDPTSKSVFRDTMKVISAHTADINELRFFVFDLVADNKFSERLQLAHTLCKGTGLFIPVPHIEVSTEAELYRLEDEALTNGYEGLMIRDPAGRYKYGRSTLSEGILLKLKRRLTSEAIIIGFEEQMHNANEATINALGRTERSSHQANLVPTGVLGAFTVRDAGVEFNVGTGFTYEDRVQFWRRRHELIGSLITYEYLPIGVKDKPRHPVFKGFRMKEDV